MTNCHQLKMIFYHARLRKGRRGSISGPMCACRIRARMLRKVKVLRNVKVAGKHV